MGGAIQRDIQETQTEDTQENQLLGPGELQCPNDRQREGEDDDVREDVPGGVDVELRVVWNAPSGCRRVPEFFYRSAHEDADEHLRQTPSEDNHRTEDENPLELVNCHDSPVLEQEGKLDGEEARVVEDDGDVKCLMRGWSVTGSHSAIMMSVLTLK